MENDCCSRNGTNPALCDCQTGQDHHGRAQPAVEAPIVVPLAGAPSDSIAGAIRVVPMPLNPFVRPARPAYRRPAEDSGGWLRALGT